MIKDAKSAIQKTELFVLDMDGTLYLGENVIDGAVEFCNLILESGRKLIYFTNNASKSPDDYVKKLERLGFPCERKNVVTSGDVTAAYLNEYHKGESVYLLGTENLEESFRKANIPLSEDANIVVVSFDTSLTYKKLQHACTLIQKGARFYSTHPDINCPTADGFIPDSGAICAALTRSTGITPKYFGKPHSETAQMIELLSQVPVSNTAVVGDRLYTDIALGKKNGFLSILVMSGETTEEMLKGVTPEELPDLKFDKVKNIIEYL